MYRLGVLTLAFALSTGCVAKGKYDAALAENEQLRGQIATKDQEAKDLITRISKLSGQIQTLQTDLDAKNRELASKMMEAGQLQRSVEEMALALQELESRRREAEANLRSYQDLVSRFQAMIDAGTLKVKVIDGRMVVELATDILFPPGAATLSKDGRTAIADVASVLASIPDREYQVAGHTDDRPIATQQFPSNWHLGAARAIAVTSLLVDSGLAAERVSAASFAEHQPADTNKTKDGRANNRRIEIVVVPDLSTLPGYDELKKLGN